jgi:glycerol uptake facilitator-like aquaporin
MTPTLQAKMLAEVISTFALIFIGAGAAAILAIACTKGAS